MVVGVRDQIVSECFRHTAFRASLISSCIHRMGSAGLGLGMAGVRRQRSAASAICLWLEHRGAPRLQPMKEKAHLEVSLLFNQRACNRGSTATTTLSLQPAAEGTFCHFAMRHDRIVQRGLGSSQTIRYRQQIELTYPPAHLPNTSIYPDILLLLFLSQLFIFSLV